MDDSTNLHAAAVKQSLTTAPPAGEQARFEAWWAVREGMSPGADYLNRKIQLAWEGWQAALAARQPVGEAVPLWLQGASFCVAVDAAGYIEHGQQIYGSDSLTANELVQRHVDEDFVVGTPKWLIQVHTTQPAQQPFAVSDAYKEGFHAGRDAAKHPAQVDLGYVRELVTRWRTDQMRDGMGWREAINNCADQLDVALALIDSQAVGNG